VSRRHSSNDGIGAVIFLALIVVALVIKFWPWILGTTLLWWLIKYGLPAGRRAIRKRQAETQAENERIARRNAELVARADAEHNALMSGDIETGMYGQYQPPEELK
jgi:hypothetical protein